MKGLNCPALQTEVPASSNQPENQGTLGRDDADMERHQFKNNQNQTKLLMVLQKMPSYCNKDSFENDLLVFQISHKTGQ